MSIDSKVDDICTNFIAEEVTEMFARKFIDFLVYKFVSVDSRTLIKQ